MKFKPVPNERRPPEKLGPIPPILRLEVVSELALLLSSVSEPRRTWPDSVTFSWAEAQSVKLAAASRK